MRRARRGRRDIQATVAASERHRLSAAAAMAVALFSCHAREPPGSAGECPQPREAVRSERVERQERAVRPERGRASTTSAHTVNGPPPRRSGRRFVSAAPGRLAPMGRPGNVLPRPSILRSCARSARERLKGGGGPIRCGAADGMTSPRTGRSIPTSSSSTTDPSERRRGRFSRRRTRGGR